MVEEIIGTLSPNTWRTASISLMSPTWVVCGDGDLMEGVSQEAISLAGRLKLNRLTVLWDDNGITIDGALTLSETGDQLARFKAAGWAL